MYQIETITSEFIQQSQGTTIRGINKKVLADLKLRIAPPQEQHRIVEAIESYLTRLDAAVALLERVQQNLKRYRAAVLKAAVEGRLVPTEAELARKEGRDYEPASELLKRILVERRKKWIENAAEKACAKAEKKAREAGKPWTHTDVIKILEKERAKAAKKYKEPAAPDTSNLPNLPEGWCWATVEQLTTGDRKCSYGVLVPGPDTPDGVRLVRVGDITGGLVSQQGMKRIARGIADRFSKTYLQGGEVLLTLVGTIGRTAVVPPSLAGANVARAVGVIPVCSSINSHWLEAWFRNPSRMHIMEASAHEVARKTLNLEDVRAAPVAVPPVLEQQRILTTVESMEMLGRNIEKQMSTVQQRGSRLHQSILKWAFEGKLVAQDPEDEPASVLLERIKAKRESMQPRKRPRPSRRKKNEPTTQDKQLDLLGGSTT